jgi:branched-chain amino acid transport system ATP-binding protein
MLYLENVYVSYGNVKVLFDINLNVYPKEIVALIGANGAGKSTTLKTISGLLKPTQGKIIFEEKRIDSQNPEAIVSLGIAHVPEGRRVFPGLTVLENLEVGTASWRGWGNVDISSDIEQIFNMFPLLKERANQLAWSMSGGEQQMLSIGRALMARPKLILMDEPSLGLSPLIVKSLFDTILEIQKSGTTVLLVEQNAHMALNLATRAYVLENGEVVLHGETEELKRDERVRTAYLSA